MTPDLALTIAAPFVGLGVPTVLVISAAVIFPDRRPRPSTVDDRSWRAEMLRAVEATRLSDELRAAREELAHRRADEFAARQRAMWAADRPVLGRPPESYVSPVGRRRTTVTRATIVPAGRRAA